MRIETADAELQAWFASYMGRAFQRTELRQLDAAMADLRGLNLLQLGTALGPLPLTAPGVRARHTIAAVPGEGVDAVAAPEALPVSSDSVDAVVMPHVLELHSEPHAVLREVHRALVPEGHVVISGFSPWSAIGLARALRRSATAAPWNANLLGMLRVKDWLTLLGFEVVGGGAGIRPPESFGAAPFGRNPPIDWDAMSRLTIAGQPAGALLAGLYVLVARKRVRWIRPVVSRWRPRRLVAVGLAEPSVRVARRG